MADRDLRDPSVLPADVLQWWRAKDYKPHFSFWDVWSEEHANAFGAAKLLRKDVLVTLREELDRSIADGLPFDQFRRSLKPRFEELGFWEPQKVRDPDTGEHVTINPPARLKTIFDTNMRTARAQSQYERQVRQAKTRPYLIWTLGPSRVHRPEHVALEGLCLPIEHEFWLTAYPPCLWGCHCSTRSVSKREYARLLDEGMTTQGDPILNDKGLPTGHHVQIKKPIMTEPPKTPLKAWRNSRTGETEYTPEYVHPSFASNPATRRKKAIEEALNDT